MEQMICKRGATGERDLSLAGGVSLLTFERITATRQAHFSWFKWK